MTTIARKKKPSNVKDLLRGALYITPSEVHYIDISKFINSSRINLLGMILFGLGCALLSTGLTNPIINTKDLLYLFQSIVLIIAGIVLQIHSYSKIISNSKKLKVDVIR